MYAWCIVSNGIDEWSVRMDLEGNGRYLIEVISPEFGWKDLGKTRWTSVGIAGILAEIRTENLSSTKTEPYRYANLLRRRLRLPL
jgi:hypothetical protein